MLASTGRLLSCPHDVELYQAAAAYAASRSSPPPGTSPGGTRAPVQHQARRHPLILVALNLYNSQEVLPNLVYQLMQLVLALPQGTLAVSVYESGSRDATRAWLQLLRVLLCPLGVRLRLEVGGPLRRGRDPETEGKVDRIQFLAQVRNAALAPLLNHTHARGPGAATAPEPGERYEHVLFLNDVFFCAGDALRLLGLGQDIACGLDIHTDGIFRPKDSRPLWLYDSWVSRDISGAMITGEFPHMEDAESTQRARRGLPFPAYCCWNGMAALKAQPFYQGLRFRSAQPGECRASECSLLCDDFHRLGFKRVAIDPGVQVAYHWHHMQAVLQRHASFDPQLNIAPTSWAHITAASNSSRGGAQTAAQRYSIASLVPAREPQYARVVCCSKRRDSDSIPWSQCHPHDVLATNFTAQALGVG